MSPDEILASHEYTSRIVREPNARPREMWVCGCKAEFHDPSPVLRDHAHLLHLIQVAQAHALAPVLSFIDQRPEYVKALKDTGGDDDQSDYGRWSGHAEARRQLAVRLGMSVPHEPGDRTVVSS